MTPTAEAAFTLTALWAECFDCKQAREEACVHLVEDLRISKQGKPTCEACWNDGHPYSEFEDAPKLTERLNASVASRTAEGEREAFEKAYREITGEKILCHPDAAAELGGEYVGKEMRDIWKLWQAASSRTPSAGDVLTEEERKTVEHIKNQTRAYAGHASPVGSLLAIIDRLTPKES